MEKLCREAFRSLYSYFSLMDIVFEDDVCVDLSCVLGGLTMPASLFQSSLMWLGAPLCRRPLKVQRSRCVAERRRAFKQSVSGEPSSKASLESLQPTGHLRAFKQSVFGESSIKVSLESLQAKRLILFFFLLTISLVWLPGCISNGSIMVVWICLYLFYVTIGAFWHMLIRFGF